MSDPQKEKETDGAPQEPPVQKKPNVFAKLWAKSGLTFPVVMLMMKGGLPPTIALAIYESHSVADVYTTLGYLVAIMSLLGMCIQPRAKFVQSMLFNILFVCIGAAVALLQIQCVVAARSPLPAGAGTKVGGSGSVESVAYDSSANVVAAIFLFIVVFLVNYVKSKRPQLMIPSIMASIFTIVASVYAPSFPTMASGLSFVRRLLIAFLSGFAISTGVSLFIFPVTSRKTVAMQIVGLTGLMKGALAAHGAFMQAITELQKNPKAGEKRGKAEAMKLRQMIQQLGALFGKIRLELGFARKEIAYGKLKPDHLSEIYSHLRNIMIPIIGLSTFMEIVQTVQEGGNAPDSPSLALIDSGRHVEAIKRLQTEEWDEVMSMSHDAYLELRAAISKGLDHVTYQLELAKKPKNAQKDIERSAGAIPSPGDRDFAEYLEAEVAKFHKQRETVMQEWAAKKNIQLPKHFLEERPKNLNLEPTNTDAVRNKMNQQQLYLILFIEYLTNNVGQAILKMVKYADAKVDDGTMSRKKIIHPGWRRVRKLLVDACSQSDADETMNNEVNGGSNIFVGDAFKARKNPEHLPPSNAYEKVTDWLRVVPKSLGSEESSFAFRAAMAALSIGIIAYLKDTRDFFLEQRGMWAIIMTAISMDPRAGQSVFSYVCRVGGTAGSMCASMIIWYMCDGKHAAIIVIFWLYLCFWLWFLIKNPNFAMVAMISMVTCVLILGYEMQVDVIGRQVATSNGQAFYPIYLLAPYRLVSVAAGIGVAFIWTYFPYPVTTRTSLRRDLGSTLFLLANWYSCIHTTLEVKLHLGPKLRQYDQGTPLPDLRKARMKVFAKCLLMLNRLRDHLRFLKYEPPIGGKFPKETYSELIDSMSNIFSYLSLISHSANAFVGEDGEDDIDEERDVWLKEFREFAASSSVTSHGLTSTLCLLSASVSNSTPLPPYLRVPRPFNLGDRMQDIDPDLLSIEHISHPCYAAFAVMEVASAFVTARMIHIVDKVRELVGEVDFSFHVISTKGDGSSTSSTLWEGLQQVDSSKSDSGNGKAKGD